MKTDDIKTGELSVRKKGEILLMSDENRMVF